MHHKKLSQDNLNSYSTHHLTLQELAAHAAALRTAGDTMCLHSPPTSPPNRSTLLTAMLSTHVAIDVSTKLHPTTRLAKLQIELALVMLCLWPWQSG
jgi:hypothetical protein